MFLTEYDAERQRELDRQEGIEQGIEQSIAALRSAGLSDAADLLERQRATVEDTSTAPCEQE